MAPTLRRAVCTALLPIAVLAGACGGDAADEGAAGSDPAAADTGAMDGLTQDQLEDQIRPLTPEEAAQLGIIDTAAENDQPAPVGPSSVIPGTPPPVPTDTPSAGAQPGAGR